MTSNGFVISTEDLSKSFGEVRALRDINFQLVLDVGNRAGRDEL